MKETNEIRQNGRRFPGKPVISDKVVDDWREDKPQFEERAKIKFCKILG